MAQLSCSAGRTHFTQTKIIQMTSKVADIEPLGGLEEVQETFEVNDPKVSDFTPDCLLDVKKRIVATETCYH